MKKLLIFLALILITNSCAHYGRTWTKQYHKKIDLKELRSLEGCYRIKPYQDFFKDSIAVVPKDKQSFHLLTSHLRMTEVQIDTSHVYKLDLKILNARLLKTQLYENDSIISSSILKGKLRKNGTFHLSDNINESWGIPYLLGGNSQMKTRIGKTTQGDLFVQSAYYRGGAILLIFGDMRGYNTVLSFQEIKTLKSKTDE